MDLERIEGLLRTRPPRERSYDRPLPTLIGSPRPLRSTVRPRAEAPAGARAAMVALVLVLVAGAVLYGAWRHGLPSAGQTPTLSPGSSATQTASPTPIPTPTASVAPTSPASLPPETAAGRTGHTATLLTDGRVLLAGGQGGSIFLATAQLFDPSTGRFTPTGHMRTARRDHTATLLADGRVLFAGGGGNTALASAELYDPASGRFSPTGSLTTARYDPKTVLLQGGQVLIVGGDGTADHVASAEIYDPTTGGFSRTGSLRTTQSVDTATVLQDGSVLVTGSFFDTSIPEYVPSAELYDPSSGTFAPAGSMSAVRYGATATLLPNGQVLVAGGSDPSGFSLDSAELYFPTSNTFRLILMATWRDGQTATLLSDGRVLVVGGEGAPFGNGMEASAETYDPSSGRFTPSGSLTIPRRKQTATLLPDGRVLIAGGESDVSGIARLFPNTTSGLSSLASAELFDPASGTFSLTGSMTDAP
jgi:hypothetical protein